MDYERFIRIVHRAGGMPQGEARRAARATLETLGERLDEDDATELAAKLPGELATWLVTARAREEELDLFLQCFLAHEEKAVRDRLLQIERHDLEVELVRLDLREIEDVVDDAEQRGAGVVNLADVVALPAVELGAQRQVR